MTKPKAARAEPRGMVLKGDRIHPERRDGGPSHLTRKTRRLFERLARERGSDNCHGCGRAYDNHDVTSIGYAGGGELLQVGACCARRLVKVIAGSMYFTPDSELVRLGKAGKAVQLGGGTAWSEDDRMWFAAHPERSFRLRASWPGEWDDPKAIEPCTIVRQQQPGERRRICVERMRELLPVDPPDVVLWAMFELLEEARERGEVGMISKEAIFDRARQLAIRGSA
jgi:hypothetical protein